MRPGAERGTIRGLTHPAVRLVDCTDPRRASVLVGTAQSEPSLAKTGNSSRRHVAVVITADGRRVPMPVQSGLVGLSLLELLRSAAAGLEDLLGLLITGSRRENGGTR
jgi:hypothetical protein